MKTCSLGFQSIPTGSMSHYFSVAKDRFSGSKCPAHHSGNGIVICGGGRYESWTLNNCANIRRFDRGVGIEVWHLNGAEISQRSKFDRLDVELVNCEDVLRKHPMRRFGGWESKSLAVLYSKFKNVMFLDADCFITSRALELFDHPEFMEKGAIFFPDVSRCHASDVAYKAAGLIAPWHEQKPEWESGQFLVNKSTHYDTLKLFQWMCEHGKDCWWARAHGDKIAVEIAFRSMERPFGFGESTWEKWGIRHCFDGAWRFAHCLGVKRKEATMPDLIV